VAPPSQSFEIGKQTEFAASWRNGLQFQTADQAFRVHVGGRLHGDFGWWHASDAFQTGPGGVGPLLDGANFRRARIRVNGMVYDTVAWIMEYGFETGEPAFFDTFMELTQLPVLGTFRVGHFREPFSMDALTGGNDLTFMERSLIHDAFVPFRNMGVMAQRNLADDSMTFAAGGFRGNSNAVGADADDGSYAFTTRTTWNPWYLMDGVYALHFGGNYSIRNPSVLNALGTPVTTGGASRVIFRTRPEIRINAPNFVNTGVIDADLLNLFGAELGFGSGPFLMQAEYVAAVVSPTAGAPVAGDSFHGFYIQASYFLTGENRPYNRGTGVFGEAKPYENFFCRDDCDGGRVRGSGAWEAGIRYSWIDLNDGTVQGGELSDITFGLNWHLNPASRFMFNYILMDRDAPDPAASGWAGIFATRFQIDF
jgi:phosphate-selective porin OprO/OprP